MFKISVNGIDSDGSGRSNYNPLQTQIKSTSSNNSWTMFRILPWSKKVRVFFMQNLFEILSSRTSALNDYMNFDRR